MRRAKTRATSAGTAGASMVTASGKPHFAGITGTISHDWCSPPE